MSTLLPAVTYRDAEPADAECIAGLYDRVYAGGYPVADFMDPDAVRAVIAPAPTCGRWPRSASGSSGSLVGEHAAWNRTYEICRAVMDPDFGAAGGSGRCSTRSSARASGGPTAT